MGGRPRDRRHFGSCHPPLPPCARHTLSHTSLPPLPRAGKTSNAFLSQFQAHLPERLATAVLVNPPWVFDLLLGVMRPFIDAKTMAKVKIVRPAKGGLAAELAAFGVTDAAQLAWLEAACRPLAAGDL